MNKLLKPLSLALCFVALAVPMLLEESAAQAVKAYAPEDLRPLSYNDQVRVISLEYEEQSRGRRIPDDQLRFYIDQVNRSNWGFSRIKSDITQSLGGSGWNPPSGGTARCVSFNNRGQTCRMPWSGHSRLVRQLSSEPCEEGRTWQSQLGQVYVGGNCHAEFAAAEVATPLPGPGVDQSIRCESLDNRAQTCRTPWQGPSRLSRQLSNVACVEGRTWQSQQGQVYVGGNCRAEFVPAAMTKPMPIGPHSVTCESYKDRKVECPWPMDISQPKLLRQLSKKPCIQGYSWGFRGPATLWVSRGCRGRFGSN